MTKIENGQITDILPDVFKSYPEVQALSYALNRSIKRLLGYADNTSVYAVIDKLPEDMLDILAVELRTQYYDETFDIKRKRDLIKNTLIWYRKAGTRSAVQEMIDKVFSDGIVLEWFETNSDPGTFQVSTTHVVTPKLIEQFKEYINNVKNIRSHLDSIVVGNKAEINYYMAAGVVSHAVIRIQ